MGYLDGIKNDSNQNILANTFGDMSNHDSLIIPTVQRALVLQGGGAPGAYQAGAFKALYEKLRKIVELEIERWI
jgi:predicted acylesterase/phospholipase RssA